MFSCAQMHAMMIDVNFDNLINDAFSKRFRAPTYALVKHTGPRLYAGSAVLNAFYEDKHWVPKDTDLFIGCTVTDVLTQGLLRCVIPNDGYEIETFESYFDTGFYVFKIRDVATFQYVQDIVFVITPDSTLKTLHACLVSGFDVKICALAWDGMRLYYPPTDMVDFSKRTTQVKPKILKRRIQLYHNRGFTIIVNE